MTTKDRVQKYGISCRLTLKSIRELTALLVCALLVIVTTPIHAGVPTHDFWVRFNQIFDIGKNYLASTARGTGSVAANSGAYVYKYELPLPPGRLGMAPNLTLVYSSQGGNGYLGEGWSLTIPHIKRSTKFTIPTYRIEDDFLEYVNEEGEVSHLTPVEETEKEIRYRRMRESELDWFIYRKTERIWIVLKKDGSRLEFGNPQFAAADFVRDRGIFAWRLNEDRDSTGNTIYYHYDSSGLPLLITYTGNKNKKNIDGWKPAIQVEFEYSAPDDLANIDCRRGRCVNLAAQLDLVTIKAIEENGSYQARKKIRFVYERKYGAAFLEKITYSSFTENGGWKDLPAVLFRYERSEPDENLTLDPLKRRAHEKICFTAPMHTVGRGWQYSETFRKLARVQGTNVYDEYWETHITSSLADMNGDGVQDIIVGEQVPQSDGFWVYLGRLKETGRHRYALEYGLPIRWEVSELDCVNDPEKAAYCPVRTTRSRIHNTIIDDFYSFKDQYFPGEKYFQDAAQLTQSILDINGDGLPDWIRKQCVDEDCWLDVALNNRKGFVGAQRWPLPVPYIEVRMGRSRTSNVTAAEVRETVIGFLDINGDGLPDIVDTSGWQPEEKVFLVYLNTGKGFDQRPIRWGSPLHTIDLQAGGTIGFSDNGELSLDEESLFKKLGHIDGGLPSGKLEPIGSVIELHDINGDGLVDLAFQPGGLDPSARLVPIQVYLNEGDGFESKPRSWKLARPLSLIAKITAPGHPTDDLSLAMIADFNGDRRADYLEWNKKEEQWLWYPNEGTGFASPRPLYVAEGIGLSRSSVVPHARSASSSFQKLMDINGDGVLDLVTTLQDDQAEPNCLTAVLGAYKPMRKLKQVENGYGGVEQIRYAPSPATKDPKIVYPLNVVAEVISLDKFTDNEQRRSYKYTGGLVAVDPRPDKSVFGPRSYLHPSNREFRGFSEVTETDFGKDLLTKYEFFQSAYLSGQLSNVSLSRASTNRAIHSEARDYGYHILEKPINDSYLPVLFHYLSKSVNRVCNEEENCTEIKDIQEYDRQGQLISRKEYGSYPTSSPPLRKTDWTYKSRVDLEKELYLFATKKQEFWSRMGDKKPLLQYGLTRYFHDGSEEEEYLRYGLTTRMEIFSRGKPEEGDNEGESYFSTNDYDFETGLIDRSVDFNGNEEHYKYDALANTYTVWKKRGDLVEQYAWDIALGEKILYRDPNNISWINKYDGFGRVLGEKLKVPGSSIAPALVRSFIYNDGSIYDEGSRRRPPSVTEIEVIDREDTSQASAGQQYVKVDYFSGWGNLIQSREVHNGNAHIIRNVAYDNAGRMLKVTNPASDKRPWNIAKQFAPYNWQEAALGDYSEVEYDPLGRIVAVRQSCNTDQKKVFKFGGDLTSSMTDEQGKVITIREDVFGNIVEVSNGRVAHDPLKKDQFIYDGRDRLQSAWDKVGNRFDFSRDWLGRIRKVFINKSSRGEDELSAWTFRYDGNGNTVFSRSPEGRERSYQYDEWDRVKRETFGRDGATDGIIDYEFDKGRYGKGRLTKASGPAGVTRYSYDPRGNAESIDFDNAVSGKTYRLQFRYNDVDDIKEIVYPGGAAFDYWFNQDGTVRELRRRSDQRLIAKAEYDRRRNITDITAAGGVNYEFAYDECGRTEGITSNGRFGLIMDQKLEYYDNGRISLNRDHDPQAGGGEMREFNYGYDGASRLESIVGEPYEAIYRYDEGNRLREVEEKDTKTVLEYSNEKFPWVVSGASKISSIAASDNEKNSSSGRASWKAYGRYQEYKFDNDGYLKFVSAPAHSKTYRLRAGVKLDFDARGALAALEETGATDEPELRKSWTYDHEGRLTNERIEIQKIHLEDQDRGKHVIDFVDRYFEFDLMKKLSRSFLFLGDLRLAVHQATPAVIGAPARPGKILYFHSDQLGSVRYVTDANGSILDRRQYLPFGADYYREVSSGLRYGFNGRRDEGEGIYRFQERPYHVSAFQWAAMDHEVLRAPSLLVRNGVNPYAYCANDPINRFDTTGAGFWIEAFEAVVDAAVGVADGFTFGLYSEKYLNHAVNKGKGAYRPATTAGRVTHTIGEYGPDVLAPLKSVIRGGVKGTGKLGKTVVGAGDEFTSVGYKATKSVPKSLKDQAADLIPQNANRHRVTLRSPSQKMEVDLAGNAHGGIPTPHTKVSPRNYKAPNQPAYNTKNAPVRRPATQQDIRTVRRYLERQGR